MSSNPGVRRHPLAKCEECGLNNDNCVFVPSYPAKSGETKLVIVGEAPGAQEARRGIPFAGPSGKLLDAVLKGHGLRRENTFITNACLCRPKDNATPGARDVAACSGRLREEVKEACKGGAPIITLGNVAASVIFDQKVGITSFRVGPAKESHLFPGIRVIPTVHPAYVLRMTDAFPTFMDDIGKVKENVNIRWEAPAFRVFDDAHDARQALLELQRRDGNVVVDIEAGGEKDVVFIHPDQFRVLCVGLSYARGRAIVVSETALEDTGVQRMLAGVLDNRHARIVAHNGKYDLAGLHRISGSIHLGFDTMLASYAMDERQGTHGLKYLAVEKLGAPQYDVEIHRYTQKGASFANIPPDILHKYNAYDTTCTFDLMQYQEAKMTADDRRVHNMLCRASMTLMHAEMAGMMIDKKYALTQQDEFIAQLTAMEAILARWVGNPRSPMQVSAAFRKQGVKTSSTDVEHLMAIANHPKAPENAVDFAVAMMEYRKIHKQYSTYIKGMLKRMYKGRVHPTFLLHGTTTGRLSCRNPNLQNVPRDSKIKRMFIPTPGRVFVQADYKGAELRVLACEARDRYLHQLFADGRDIHNEVATRFFGPGFNKDQRVRAKAVVFGLAYGREAYSLSLEHGWPVQEAQRYLDQFFALIPEVVRWREGIRKQILQSEDDLVTRFGRHRRIWLITEQNIKDIVKEGLAFIPQSTASDITLTAACELHEKYHLDIRNLVHDSILVECDPEDAEDVSQLMAKELPRVAAEYYDDFVPFDADVSVGYSWGEV